MVKDDENNKVPRVLNPYKDTYKKYLEAGFRGPLPVPYKDKHPPPIDFTGQRAPYPGLDEFDQWCNRSGRWNICIRLAGVDKDYEIIGLDVDQYEKGGRQKKGWDQLKALEDKLGPLPDTWISSARVDGKSGIRYFRVPRGLAFRGQCAKDIEIIRKGHRFAVVWPSIHPDQGTYWWFEPGTVPDKLGRSVWSGVLPDARTLPTLPDSWIDYLTSGRTIAVEDELIDVDSEVQEIYDWATDTFHKNDCHHPSVGSGPEEDTQCTDCGDETPPCQLMRSKLEKHKKLIEDEATSHDKLTNAHWNILHLAFEGHLGWNEAVNELEEHFINVTLDRGKRGLSEVEGEIFRSRIQALRQIKGKSDERLKIGAKAVDALCVKVGICGSKATGSVSKGGINASTLVAVDSDSGDDGSDENDASSDGDDLADIPKGALDAVDNYEMNDDGNARHLCDYFSTLSAGHSMRFADGYGWIVWHEGNKATEPHWEKDELGNQVVRRMWHKVKERQIAYVDALKADYDNELDVATKASLPISGSGAPGTLLAARAKYQKWSKWAELSGNNRQAENALKAAQSIFGVSISVNSLDRNPFLLGVSNGVVELDRDEVRLRKAQLNDFITLNTGVAWEEPTQFANDKWQEYLDTFLPDSELQKIVQVVLGHTLIGGNPEKVMVILKGDPDTGKSTMITGLESALGDYCGTVSQTIFQNHKLNPVLANSLTKRIIVCSEFDEKDQLSASQVKRLTGGSDTIQAELKGSNVTIEGVPQFVPVLATNAVPTISGADKALQNRLFVIPFNIVPRKVDKSFSRVIKDVCATAVLHWLVEGFVKYRELGGLPVSTLIEQETQDFMGQTGDIAYFANEILEKHNSGMITPAAMYLRFEQWWNENSYQPRDKPNQHKFSRTLSSLDWKKKQIRKDGKSTPYWVGVRFNNKIISMPNRDIVKGRANDSN